jgi:hypothetical protein
MRKTLAAIAGAGALALVAAPAAADHDPSTSFTGSCAAVQDLRVAPEDRNGYDRDAFGDYDRDALLAASMEQHGDYYSAYDNVHYDDASEVDVDHAVALAEAWDSGADEWSEARRDEFAGDTANLALLTDNVNQSKSAQDIEEWQPSYDGAVGGYVTRWVQVKSKYDLSVNQAEREALLALTGCSEDTTPPADDTDKDNEDDDGKDKDRDETDDGQVGDESDEGGSAPTPTPQKAHLSVTG